MYSVVWTLFVIGCLIACQQVSIISAMTRMFPEGRSPWHLPMEIAAFFLPVILTLTCPFLSFTLVK